MRTRRFSYVFVGVVAHRRSCVLPQACSGDTRMKWLFMGDVCNRFSVRGSHLANRLTKSKDVTDRNGLEIDGVLLKHHDGRGAQVEGANLLAARNFNWLLKSDRPLLASAAQVSGLRAPVGNFYVAHAKSSNHDQADVPDLGV